MTLKENQRLPEAISFLGCKVIRGSGRGKKIGIPTINVDPAIAKNRIEEGVYAGWALIGGTQYAAAIHYGVRPVFRDTKTFEVHIIDAFSGAVPKTLDIQVVGFIRKIAYFATVEELLHRIEKDIVITKGIL